MAINLVCKVCKSNLSVRFRLCKNCGYNFSNGKKYKVVVKCKDGRRISKVLDSISIAKKFERKLKTQSIENNLFGITQIPVLDEVWDKYISWAMCLLTKTVSASRTGPILLKGQCSILPCVATKHFIGSPAKKLLIRFSK